MVVGPRHATAFRAFGDRAIVTGYPTVRLPALPNGDREWAPRENPAREQNNSARICRSQGPRGVSHAAAAGAAGSRPGAPGPGRSRPGRLTLRLADALRL